MKNKKATNSIANDVDICITKSMAIIEKLCPRNNVCLGIRVRDSYHNGDIPKFSMFTACEMLWAVTTSGKYSRAHYLIVELLTAINTELENGYFSKKDRAFEKAFILLATTSAGQSIREKIYVETVESILDSQKNDGAWSSYSGGEADLRATALNVVALSECNKYVGATDLEPFSKIELSVTRACEWIKRAYTESGYCERIVVGLSECGTQPQRTPGIELTAWCTYALIVATESFEYYKNIARGGTENFSGTIKKSIIWMTQQDIDKVAETPEIESEIYLKDIQKPKELTTHEYGAGSLEILILALLAYRQSRLYKYIKNFNKILENSIFRLMKNMNQDGEWYDKNSCSYSRAWPVSYALKVLTTFREYLVSQETFKTQLFQQIRIIISLIPAFLWKYKIAIFFIALTTVSVCFADTIKTYIQYFNSPIFTIIGLALSAISVWQGSKK